MEFNNIIEEENFFPYIGLSLAEAREIRYLIRNMETFKNGKVIQMGLRNNEKCVYANGMYAGDVNKTFESYIYRKDYGYKIFSVIVDVLSHRDYYSVDEFLFEPEHIKVISEIENMNKVENNIDYFEESCTRK